ncbi:MAG: DUF1616 domain-containing protein [Candidatus Bathyarchaeia archaeon]
MKLEDYRVVFVAVGLIGVLLLATPVLSLVLHLPGGERFSELYILGPENMAEDLPGNVTAGVNYLINVGVGCHMGSSTYYVLYVKFRNETEPLPNSTAGTPSVLSPLYTYRMFIEDNGSSEFPLTFSFSNVSFSNNQSNVGNLLINGVSSSVDKSVSWDAVNSGYYYQLFTELWIYDPVSDGFGYHNRFVTLWLNMTASP